jgi:hypothetical protein
MLQYALYEDGFLRVHSRRLRQLGLNRRLMTSSVCRSYIQETPGALQWRNENMARLLLLRHR